MGINRLNPSNGRRNNFQFYSCRDMAALLDSFVDPVAYCSRQSNSTLVGGGAAALQVYVSSLVPWLFDINSSVCPWHGLVSRANRRLERRDQRILSNILLAAWLDQFRLCVGSKQEFFGCVRRYFREQLLLCAGNVCGLARSTGGSQT